ncbi:MAG: tetratricopeptide repeat protein [Sedimentisphaerales bacterium]|nr:tetratricopeptide repeat protein [Sedimentisphaerales bacterium]
MSKLLEIFGRAIAVDTAELILHWLDSAKKCQADSETESCRQLNEIIGLLSSGQIETAQQQTKLYLADNPASALGSMAAADVYIQKNELRNALEQLNSIYLRYPSNTMALYALGHCYERLCEESKAVEFYQDCLKFKNYLQFPRQRLAAIYFKNGRIEKTIQEYELLKDEYPDDLPTLATLGHLYIANGKYDLAIDRFNTAILVHPDNTYCEDDYLEQLINEQSFQEAAEHIANSLEDAPQRADLHVKYAEVLSAIGNPNEAIDEYKQAIELSPYLLEAAIKLGTLYLNLEQDKLAAHQFNKSARINDEIVDAYIGLASARKLLGDHSGALSTLSLAAAIDANSTFLLTQSAILQFRKQFAGSSLPDEINNDPAELYDFILKAHHNHLMNHPHNPQLYYRLAVYNFNLGRAAESIQLLKEALKINPTFTRVKNKLIVCLFESNNNKAAFDALIEPQDIDRRILELHYKTALLYCDKLKFASSVINLTRAMEKMLTHTEPTENLSIVLENLGLIDPAESAWDSLCDTAGQAMDL